MRNPLRTLNKIVRGTYERENTAEKIGSKFAMKKIFEAFGLEPGHLYP